jgi:arginine repressor
MEPLEEVIFKTISSKKQVSTQEILRAVDNAGISVSRQYVMRVINKMIVNYVIRRTSWGKYSTKRDPEVVQNSRESDAKIGGIIEETQPKAVTELVKWL